MRARLAKKIRKASDRWWSIMMKAVANEPLKRKEREMGLPYSSEQQKKRISDDNRENQQ